MGWDDYTANDREQRVTDHDQGARGTPGFGGIIRFLGLVW
jgi:hypothetical protein